MTHTPVVVLNTVCHSTIKGMSQDMILDSYGVASMF